MPVMAGPEYGVIPPVAYDELPVQLVPRRLQQRRPAPS